MELQRPGPKRHHTVPRFLLERFSGQDGFLARLETKTGRTSRCRPEQAAVIGRYYRYRRNDGQADDSIEFLLAEIEGMAAPAIRSLELSPMTITGKGLHHQLEGPLDGRFLEHRAGPTLPEPVLTHEDAGAAPEVRRQPGWPTGFFVKDDQGVLEPHHYQLSAIAPRRRRR